jgi:hypothetical protein
MTAAQAETRGAADPRTLACPVVQSGNVPAEPGELVRELYRLVSGPAGVSKDWARLRTLHAPGAIITAPQHAGDRVAAATYNVEQFIALNDKLFGQRGLERIQVLLKNGFTLAQIEPVASMFGIESKSRRQICADVIRLYHQKLEELDGRIASLAALRERAAARLDYIEQQRREGGPADEEKNG